MINAVINGLATATFMTDIVIGILLLAAILTLFQVKGPYLSLKKWLSPQVYYLLFLSTLIAMLGSLFFSEIAKFQPCILCWYQRILMYPQAVVNYIAIVRGERVLRPYLIALNLIGAVIATYHYALQRFPRVLIAPCEVSGAVSCVTVKNWYYGYISIPMMALSVFVFNLIILTLYYKLADAPKRKK